MNYKFPKSERLTSEKEISALFGSKHKLTSYPFKVQWQQNGKDAHQVLIACPKRNFKKAVDRNLIKRRVREAYRLNKDALKDLSNEDVFFNIAFVFIGNEIMDYDVIQLKFLNAVNKLKEEINNHE